YLNDKNLKHFDRLIDVLADYQRQNKTELADSPHLLRLLDIIIKCLSS
ncbi:unnamed protein product, partial [Didymodactylos carnosus]